MYNEEKEKQDRAVLVDFIKHQIFNGGWNESIAMSVANMGTGQMKTLCAAARCAVSKAMNQLSLKTEIEENLGNLDVFLGLDNSNRMILNMKFLKEFKNRQK